MSTRQAQKFIDTSANPIITALGIKFLETSADKVSSVSKVNNKTYKSLGSATNEGMAFRKLQPAVEVAVWDTLYTIAGMSGKGFRENALKQAIVAYLNRPNATFSEYRQAA